jgi:hypothetical protein
VKEFVIGVAAGLFVAECGPWSEWLAIRLVQFAARLQYLDRGRAEVRTEELAAMIKTRPGNIFKLCTALGFTVGASFAWIQRCWQGILLYKALHIPRSRPESPGELTTATKEERIVAMLDALIHLEASRRVAQIGFMVGVIFMSFILSSVLLLQDGADVRRALWTIPSGFVGFIAEWWWRKRASARRRRLS